MQYRQVLLKLIIPTIAIIVGLWLLYLLRQALVILFISFLLASALYPAVEWLEQCKLPRVAAIVVLYATFIAVAAGIGALCFHLVATEGMSLFTQLPSYLNQVSNQLGSVPGMGQLAWTSEQITRTITGQAYNLVTSTVNYLSMMTSIVITFLSVLILTFMMLLQSRDIHRTLLMLVPQGKRHAAENLMKELARKTGGYVRGQLVVAFAVGLMIWVGLQLLGVPYAPILAVIATVFDVIPIVGSIAASVLGFIVALAHEPLLAVWTLGVYLIANQVEQNVLSPIILGKAVGLSTFWVLVSILCGTILYGVPGLYVAVPVAVVLQLVVRYLSKDSRAGQNRGELASSGTR